MFVYNKPKSEYFKTPYSVQKFLGFEYVTICDTESLIFCLKTIKFPEKQTSLYLNEQKNLFEKPSATTKHIRVTLK